MNQEIYPCLWFKGSVREAADYYCSIFKESEIIDETPIVIICKLNGNKFMLLSGNPEFSPNETASYVVSCDTQDEIDYYWNSLTANGGKESMCGWLEDKYGVSWQIIPSMIGSLLTDPEKGKRVMDEVMKMKKLDLQKMLDA